MSCIELYGEVLCHFHLLSIENIADFVTCSSIRAVCVCVCVCARARARACVCVCVWWLGMGVDKFIQNQAGGARGSWRT